MASESAEPTTRQQCEREGLTPIPDHGVLLIDCSVHGPVSVITAGDDEYGRAEAEFAKHLLADPAQTTDSDDWVRLKQVLGIANSEPLPGNEEAIVAAARMYIDRTSLSLLLRGMARKLVAYRKWTLGDDVPEVHRLRRQLAEATEINQEWQRYKQRKIEERRRLESERDERQARIDAALALMDYWDAHGGSIPQGHRLRALLRGDQPPAEEPTPERVPCGNPDRHCGRRGGSAHCGGCRDDEPSPLSGEALRDVEERDDAAGDLP